MSTGKTGWPPQTEQRKYTQPGVTVDTQPSTACPPCTDHLLDREPSRTRIGAWEDEQTFCAKRPGNRVTKEGNY